MGTEEYTEGLTVQKSRQTEFATQSVWEIIIKGQKNKRTKETIEKKQYNQTIKLSGELYCSVPCFFCDDGNC